MPQTIRYHLDEHCPEALAEGLRLHGIDVTTSVEADLLSSTDEEQLAYSLAQGRMLFTQDEDFLRLHVAGKPHAGIAYCHPLSRSLGEIIRGLLLIWQIYEASEMNNRLEFL